MKEENGMPLVSVIIPVYGVERYLAECVDSLLTQTHKDLEIILVDDQSPDRCPEICDAYARKDQRIRVIHKPNGGAASARNAGLDAARGAYICFVDSDDVVSVDYVEKLLKELTSAQADIAVCGFTQYTKTGQTVCADREHSGVYQRNEYLGQFLKNWTCALLWNKIFRSDVIGKLRMVEGHKIDDEFFTYQVVLNAEKIAVFDQPLYHYRMRRSSVMRDLCADGGRLLLDRIEYMQRRYGHVCDRAPQLKNDFFADLVDSYARYWTGCAQVPEAQKQIRKWTREHTGAILLSPLSWKQKLIYLNALVLRKAGGKALEQRDATQEQTLFE